MAITLMEGDTIESETAKWSRWARAQESWVMQLPEGGMDRREMQKLLNYSCWVLGQLEEMADVAQTSRAGSDVR
jgi:hypothetical protein